MTCLTYLYIAELHLISFKHQVSSVCSARLFATHASPSHPPHHPSLIIKNNQNHNSTIHQRLATRRFLSNQSPHACSHAATPHPTPNNHLQHDLHSTISVLIHFAVPITANTIPSRPILHAPVPPIARFSHSAAPGIVVMWVARVAAPCACAWINATASVARVSQ